MIFKGKLDLIKATFKKILNGPGFLGFASLALLCGFLFLGYGQRPNSRSSESVKSLPIEFR